jgi:hypothetical protein
MEMLDLPKKEFYAYARYMQAERHYKSDWRFVIFKANYGVWVDRAVRFDDGIEVEPQAPSEEFVAWVDYYIENFKNNDTKGFEDYKDKKNKEFMEKWHKKRNAELEKLHMQSWRNKRKNDT